MRLHNALEEALEGDYQRKLRTLSETAPMSIPRPQSQRKDVLVKEAALVKETLREPGINEHVSSHWGLL